MKRLSRGVPAALGLGLLVFQAILPWTARYFMTMDGPSHLYNARVIGEVVLNPSSPYRKFYKLRSALTTNWGSVLLFNLVSRLTTTYAEPVVATLAVLAALLSFFYLLRSLDSSATFSPVINFISLTWFLWVGFYNFYIGMALFALAVGYYVRHSVELSWRRAAALSLLLLATFFTHILPAVLAVLTLLIVSGWLHGFRRSQLLVPLSANPAHNGRRGRNSAPCKDAAASCALLIAIIPVCLLMGSFVLASREGIRVTPDVVLAWHNFPSRVFAETFQKNPSGTYLYPFVAGYLLLGIVLLRRAEWVTARGGLLAATGVCFVLYLVVPSHGFGGDDINARVAWAVFILGCTVAASGSRMQMLGVPVALYITGFLGVQLYRTMNRNVRNVSRAVEEYARATEEIPPGATVVRIHFDTVPMSRKYGYRGLSLDPVYHADAWMAARHGWVDLSDYQALSRVFALECTPLISDRQRADLWDLEKGEEGGLASLRRLLDDFPVPIDYVLVLGNTGSEHVGLDGQMDLVQTTGTGGFLRVYRRRESEEKSR
jgi:hypothetical protein